MERVLLTFTGRDAPGITGRDIQDLAEERA